MGRITIGRYAVLVMVGGLAACSQGGSKGGAKGRAPASTAAPDTTRSRPRSDTTLSGRAEPADPTPAAMTPPAQPAGPRQYGATALVGSWDLVAPEGSRGPHLTVTIDSARRSTFYGRLTRALSGDLELSNNFLPFKGTVDTAGRAKFRIMPSQKGSPPARFEGHVESDRMRLSSFVWAEEEQVKPDKAWELRKTKTK